MNTSLLAQKLRSLGRVQFAYALEKLFDVTAQEYSQNLFSYSCNTPLEKELKASFQKNLEQHLSQQDVQNALDEIEQYRTLQTTTHVTISEGATFFATHWLASSGLDLSRPYLIAAFSGVPFSNKAWSGCLNYGHQTKLENVLKPSSPFFKQALQAEKSRMQDCNDKRLSLISSSMRDTLVYQSKLPERLLQISDDLQNDLLPFVPQLQTHFFTDWAVVFSQNLARYLLPQAYSIYFDINKVVADYLIQVLTDKSHPIHQMLYVQNSDLSELHLFCCPSANGQKVMQIPLDQLPQSPDQLCSNILYERWCPAPFLVFTVLAGLNQFCCLGGFEQIEYFAKFQKIWDSLEGFQAPKLEPQQMLTTARFVDSQGLGVFPIDCIVHDLSWSLPSKQILASSLMQPIIKQILSI